MVAPNAGQHAHSARVEILLLLDQADAAQVIPVAQVDRGFLITRELIVLPRTQGEIVLRIDGREHRRQVLLPDGLGRDGSKKARVLKAG